MTKRINTLLMIVFLTLLTGAVTNISAQDEPEEVRFFMTFVPNIQFAPVYVAIEKGYDAQNNLSFQIEHGDEPIGVDLIAAGEVDLGIISGEQVIMARAGGRPVVYVYEWFQQYPVGIVIPDTTEGIETMSDLEGHKVGIPGRFGASYTGLIALLRANDMTEDDIQLEAIGFVAPDVVCADAVEAAVVYINNEPLQIQQRADAGECGDITSVSVIPVSDSADMVSNGLVVSESRIEDDPDFVTAAVDAFGKGVVDTIINPAEAYLISLDYVETLEISDEFRAALEDAAEAQQNFLMEDPNWEEIARSRADLLELLKEQFDPQTLIQFEVLLNTIDLWQADQPGTIELESWEITRDVLDSMGLLTGPVDVENAFTDAFVPVVSIAP